MKVYIDTVPEPIPGNTLEAQNRNEKINYATQLLAEKLEEENFEVTSEKVENATGYLEKMRERSDPQSTIIVICSVGMKRRFEQLRQSEVERDFTGVELQALTGWNIMSQKFNFIPVVFRDQEGIGDGDVIPSLLGSVQHYSISITPEDSDPALLDDETESVDVGEEVAGLGVSDENWKQLERLTLDRSDLQALIQGAERDHDKMKTACNCCN